MSKKTIKGILLIMRPNQWYKNLVVFLALIFSGNLFNKEMFLKTVIAFVGFCLLSSAVYTLNDIMDQERDKYHPTKRHRPLASGMISSITAWMVFFVLTMISFWYLNFLSFRLFIIGVLYMLLNVLYSLIVKRTYLVDIIALSVGYILRAVAGAYAIDVNISDWLLVTVFQIALILALIKRRNELYLEAGIRHRDVLREYSTSVIDSLLLILVTGLLVSYLMYIITVNPVLSWTMPMAFYAIFRLIDLVKREQLKQGVESLLMDIPFMLNLILWFIITVVAIYVGLPKI